MTACLYEGSIRHRRFAVRAHAFRHPLALLYVDVDRVGDVLGGRLVADRPGIVRFRRADYLGDPSRPLDECVRRLVWERLHWWPDGPVRLLAHPRTFGHCFNPVSLYFCFDAGEQLGAVVAEVTNTPWGERTAYVLTGGNDGRVLRGETAKRLHVSPFMSMEQTYVWRTAAPGATLSVHIENREGDRVVFDATLSLRHAPLTPAALRRMMRRYPFATLRVLALIYGHALALWLKRVPVAPKPHAAPS